MARYDGYYVDAKYGDDSNSGKSFESALATLGASMAFTAESMNEFSRAIGQVGRDACDIDYQHHENTTLR